MVGAAAGRLFKPTDAGGEGEVRQAIAALGRAMEHATWPAQQRALSQARERLFDAGLLFVEGSRHSRAPGAFFFHERRASWKPVAWGSLEWGGYGTDGRYGAPP